MNSFSIRDIENLTGVKAHTLRAWEKRYGIVIPPTPPGKHRVYSSEDLRQILKITSLYHSGLKISKIADMSAEELNAAAGDSTKKTNFDVFITELIDYTIGMEEVPFKRLVSQLVETMGIENMYLHVLFPVLGRIGSLWLTGHIIPLQEHFASNIIRNEIIRYTDGLSTRQWRNNNTALLFTPSNEHHEIPLLYINYVLRKNQIKTLYLGSDASLGMVSDCLKKNNNITVLLLYMVTNLLEKDAAKYLQELAGLFPDSKIICGGPALKQTHIKNQNIHVVHDMPSFVGLTDKCML